MNPDDLINMAIRHALEVAFFVSTAALGLYCTFIGLSNLVRAGARRAPA